MRRCYTTKVWEDLLKDMGTPGYPQYLTESAFFRLEFDVYEHVRVLFSALAMPSEMLSLVQAHPQVASSKISDGVYFVSMNLRTLTEMSRKLNCSGWECADFARLLPGVSSTVHGCLTSGSEEKRFGGEKPGSGGASESEFRVIVVQQLAQEAVRKLAKADLPSGEVVKHAFATVEVEGISRACSHQLVRHRLFSYSQESQRFSDAVNETGVVPPSVSADDRAASLFREHMEASRKAYTKLRELGIKKEDARFVLPTALKTKILMTASAYQLLHASFYRSSFSEVGNKAQWEINQLFTTLYAELRKHDSGLPERIAET
jgi:flavin-dependent thymidylate synthase